MKKVFIPLFFFILLFASVASTERRHPERWYQEKWCKEQAGQIEVTLPDKTRCDCLTQTHAVEIDFAASWKEGLGQALHYAAQSRKKAGIVLILDSPRDYKYWTQLKHTINYHSLPVDKWMIINDPDME